MYSCFNYHCFPYSFYTYRQRLDYYFPGSVTNSCYSYDSSSDSWSPLASDMNEKRQYAAAAVNDDGKWWITGTYSMFDN